MSNSATTAPAWSLDLAKDTLTLDGIQRLRPEVLAAMPRRDQFRDLLESIPESGEGILRRGIGYWILGRNADAIELLKNAHDLMQASKGGRIAEFILAKAYLAS